MELKQLAAYLPYELKAIDIRTKEIRTVTWLHFTYDLKSVGMNHLLCEGLIISKHLPILRPMSDFKNDMGPTIWAMEIDKKYNYNVYMSSGYSHVPVDRYPYPVFNYLIENHFDVFGLIQEGLAIDINTL